MPDSPARQEKRKAPSTERGRRSRDAIIAGAAALMYERGTERTSVDDVLAHSGTGKSQLYHYFSDKHDLIRSVIEYQYEQVLSGQPRLQRLRSWRDFEQWADAFVARHETLSGPLACRLGRFAADVDNDEVLRQSLATAFTAWQSHLVNGLEHLQQTGQLSEEADPSELAAGTLAAIQGGIMLSRIHRDPAPLRAAMTMAMAHLHSLESRTAGQ